MQTVGIQTARRIVRRDAEHHPMIEQHLHQAPEHHRIGNIRDMEFVEAHQPRLPRNPLRYFDQRIGLVTLRMQGFVNFAHEAMEMHAPLARIGHGGKKTIHQEALAASDAAPKPDAARQGRMDQQFPEFAASSRLKDQQVAIQLLQALRRRQLRGVGHHAARRQLGMKRIDHAIFRNVQNTMRHSNF